MATNWHHLAEMAPLRKTPTPLRCQWSVDTFCLSVAIWKLYLLLNRPMVFNLPVLADGVPMTQVELISQKPILGLLLAFPQQFSHTLNLSWAPPSGNDCHKLETSPDFPPVVWCWHVSFSLNFFKLFAFKNQLRVFELRGLAAGGRCRRIRP
jgi:hypothetical protein